MAMKFMENTAKLMDSSPKFMDKNFLLETKTARSLYFDHAATLPIIDYHCHVNPKEIADDRRFENISQIWLGGDHYKWRLMRACGVPEEKITGKTASDREKFQLFAESLSRAIGNPIYHWAHLELQRYFDYYGVLNANTAEEVWNLCNAKLATSEMSVRQIINKSNVAALCTTDDPIDDLIYHIQIAGDSSFSVKVLPTWRPDKVVNLTAGGYADYISKLGEVAQINITNLAELKQSLEKRLEYFAQQGCMISDHALDKAYSTFISEEEADSIFQKALQGSEIAPHEEDGFKTYLVSYFAAQYNRMGWAMQLHFSAERNTNSARFEQLGPDTGFDCIGRSVDVNSFVRFLDSLQRNNNLPKTVVYSLNPNDEEVLLSAVNCFQGEGFRNKIQVGAPWWFNDTKSNMERGFVNQANATVLGNFVGMLTDSRSFLSYPRHEYFRRILCNTIGSWVENGEVPSDEATIGQIVEDISYNNANQYFGFGL